QGFERQAIELAIGGEVNETRLPQRLLQRCEHQLMKRRSRSLVDFLLGALQVPDFFLRFTFPQFLLECGKFLTQRVYPLVDGFGLPQIDEARQILAGSQNEGDIMVLRPGGLLEVAKRDAEKLDQSGTRWQALLDTRDGDSRGARRTKLLGQGAIH